MLHVSDQIEPEYKDHVGNPVKLNLFRDREVGEKEPKERKDRESRDTGSESFFFLEHGGPWVEVVSGKPAFL